MAEAAPLGGVKLPVPQSPGAAALQAARCAAHQASRPSSVSSCANFASGGARPSSHASERRFGLPDTGFVAGATLKRRPWSSASCALLPSPPVRTQRGSSIEAEVLKASLPAKEGIYSRKWTTEQKRFLHEHRQRDWLQRKAKHSFIDFSDSERAELRRYFDALATSNDRISLDRLETMLISLGLASTRKEVRLIVSKIDTNGNGQLDFEEYLEIFRARADSEIFQVFKAMMEGRLGDPNLNFQTVISTYRRNLFLDATGARGMRPVRLPSDRVPSEHSAKVLHNFATLQKTRYDEAASSEAGMSLPLDQSMLPFDPTGMVPPGGLGMVWRGVTSELELSPSRPPSAEGRRRMGPPQSPRQVIGDIVKAGKVKKNRSLFGNTVVIQAPALEEGTQEAWRRNKAQPLNEDDA